MTVTTCPVANKLLDKRDLNSGKKMAQYPEYNAASQYLAHQLNVVEGGPIEGDQGCAGANYAADLVQYYLDRLNFVGVGNFKFSNATTKKTASNLNKLAGILDHYNNDTLTNCTVNYVTSQLDMSVVPNPVPNVALP